MRQLRYSVAASLDGYIAGPDGEYDWIVVDPDIDFAAMYASFSGLVMGRKSYDVSWPLAGAPARRSRSMSVPARCRKVSATA